MAERTSQENECLENGAESGAPKQVRIRGVDDVEIVDLVQQYPPYAYYHCRVRASVTYPAGSSPVGDPVAEIKQGDNVLQGGLPMHHENGDWYTNVVWFSADPELPIKGCVTAKWMIMYEHSRCSEPTPLSGS